MPPQQIQLNVTIEATLPAIVSGAVSFETGADRAATENPDLCVYDHHGPEFCDSDKGALTAFFEDLIFGKPFPTTFATLGVNDIDTLLAIALFLKRDLAIHPATPGLVMAADLVHRRGLPAIAHIEPDLGRFFQFLRGYVKEPHIPKRVLGERVGTSVQWISDYLLDGTLPRIGQEPEVTILDHGTNGFVLAESSGGLFESWVGVYRKGFLKGAVFGPEQNGRRNVLGARKSGFVAFDLHRASRLLNEVERAAGAPPEWKADDLWLFCPDGGTVLTPKMVIEILIRV